MGGDNREVIGEIIRVNVDRDEVYCKIYDHNSLDIFKKQNPRSMEVINKI